jgi:hypothetical protein
MPESPARPLVFHLPACCNATDSHGNRPEQAFLPHLQTLLANMLNRQLGQVANFLECDFMSNLVIAAVEQKLTLVKSFHQPVPSCAIHKLRMQVNK